MSSTRPSASRRSLLMAVQVFDPVDGARHAEGTLIRSVLSRLSSAPYYASDLKRVQSGVLEFDHTRARSPGTMLKPIWRKCRSVVRASFSFSSRITTKLVQSVNE